MPIYFLILGFFRYWQRQGFCALILEQQSEDGGVFDEIAAMQGLSSVGLHVAALERLASAMRRISTAQIAT